MPTQRCSDQPTEMTSVRLRGLFTHTYPYRLLLVVYDLLWRSHSEFASGTDGKPPTSASLSQWRSNRVCKSCSARGPIAVEAQTNPVRGREGGALLESLHTGLLRPCYATDLTPLKLGPDVGACVRNVGEKEKKGQNRKPAEREQPFDHSPSSQAQTRRLCPMQTQTIFK